MIAVEEKEMIKINSPPYVHVYSEWNILVIRNGLLVGYENGAALIEKRTNIRGRPEREIIKVRPGWRVELASQGATKKRGY